MRILFAFVFLAACSSDKPGSDAGTSNKDAAPADASTTMDASMDTGSSGDACMATWSACQNCVANGCSTELVACTMDTACKNALTALASCVNGCGASCKQTFQQTSGTPGAMLATCMTSSCAKDCP